MDCDMYEDAVDLANNRWVGLNHRTDKKMAIKPVLLNFAGFECDSISAMNNKRKLFTTCVADGEGKTGRTAQATLSYTVTHRPLISLWENVLDQ